MNQKETRCQGGNATEYDSFTVDTLHLIGVKSPLLFALVYAMPGSEAVDMLAASSAGSDRSAQACWRRRFQWKSTPGP